MNKWQSWLTRGTIPIFTLGAIAALSQPSTASNVQVACKTNASTPKVVVTLNQQGKTEDHTILNFLPQYFSAADAMQNCQHTAQSLQSVYDTGNSKYLTADRLNNQPVVCAVERRGIGCNHYSAEVLFSFNSTDNPSQVFYEMLGKDFKQAQPLDVRTISRTYTATKPSWWPF